MSADKKPYPEIPQSPSFPEIEEEIGQYWEDEGIFQKSVEQRPSTKDGKSNEFVFYDGPPFANGLPHYGHFVTGYVKDIVPRYRTMRGNRVERRFGWDCHGLPAELTSEKELGISGRQDILKMGIDKFNAHCQTSVLRFTDEWQSYVTRQGRWVDFANDYKTMDISFMESVLWGFKQLWDKGYVYEGYRVVPYSWAVQTPLSNFETRLDNSYRERQDPALTVGLQLHLKDGETVPTQILIWTTTPWTLPSNLAAAVGPDIDYAILEKDGKRIILADEAVARYEREFSEWEKVGDLKGRDLVGRTYEPLFPYFASADNAFRILGAAFVETGEGTGVVHMAPGFGEDDLDVCMAEGIPLFVPVDEAGCFTAEVPDYQGQNVLEANKAIIGDLKERGVVYRHESYLHNYPHCWRTDEPLIFKAINAWYVKVTAFRDRMVELNKGITWTPDHIRDGLFGNWLENARDWNISRNRFWGCPIPVWMSDDPNFPRTDVYGSLDELERDFGVRPTDLHRPMIDDLTRPNPDDPTGKSMMRRVPEVLDVWFDSGSMPFAQEHYPFENKERFEDNFPADFIVEYVAQTRGWFYTMMVLSTALFDRAPFLNCVCHGVVLDEDKQKLSKRLMNYPDPIEVFKTHGSDALRWYMVSSPLMAGGDLAMPRDGSAIGQSVRQAILPLWNAYSFFTLYANIDGYQAEVRSDQSAVIDRYILAKTRELVTQMTGFLEANDLPAAYNVFPGYLDALNNWFIRRSRTRFWREGNDSDKKDAYDTLYTVLTTVCRALAPLMPFLSDYIYRNLTGEASVHLVDWPEITDLPEEKDLVKQMDRVRDICSAVMNLREKKRLRVRLPLRSLTVAHADKDALAPYADLIRQEVNVKEITLSADPLELGERQVKVNPQIGKRIGKAMKDVMAASRSGDWDLNGDGTLAIGGITLPQEDFSMTVTTPEGTDSQAFDTGTGLVVLDTQVDAALEREGLSRDLIRLVQQTRKEADLNVSDRIDLSINGSETVNSVVGEFADQIKLETLATSLSSDAGADGAFTLSHDLDKSEVQISVKVA